MVVLRTLENFGTLLVSSPHAGIGCPRGHKADIMTTAGDAAPDGSRSPWILRLHRDPTTAPSRPSSSRGDPTVVLAGDVVTYRGHPSTEFGAVSIHRRPATRLELSPDVMELHCELRDLPPTNNCPPATDLQHVVHVLCSRFADPEAIERFLDATRGLLDGYALGREAWFEVLAQPIDRDGTTTNEPIVDDVFIGRYESAERWRELHEWEPWKTAIEALEAEATTIFHLVIAPTINRMADIRRSE